jgi:hypothetical protein
MRYTTLGILAAALWYGVEPAVAQDRWNWSGRLAQGRALEIRGINGTITAEPAAGDRVEVTAEKHGRRSDPAEVRIEVVEHDGGATICAVYPGRRNRCEPGGGSHRVRDNDVEVDFTVRVPGGVRFAGSMVNGGIEAVGLQGPVEAATVNGSVRLDTRAGEARATTVNGSITATVRARGEQPLRFRTVNGSITVALPDHLGADLVARTVNGSIHTDFSIQVQGRLSPRYLSGRIGNGGQPLELETVNGTIRLNRLR